MSSALSEDSADSLAVPERPEVKSKSIQKQLCPGSSDRRPDERRGWYSESSADSVNLSIDSTGTV